MKTILNILYKIYSFTIALPIFSQVFFDVILPNQDPSWRLPFHVPMFLTGM